MGGREAGREVPLGYSHGGAEGARRSLAPALLGGEGRLSGGGWGLQGVCGTTDAVGKKRGLGKGREVSVCIKAVASSLQSEYV